MDMRAIFGSSLGLIWIFLNETYIVRFEPFKYMFSVIDNSIFANMSNLHQKIWPYLDLPFCVKCLTQNATYFYVFQYSSMKFWWPNFKIFLVKLRIWLPNFFQKSYTSYKNPINPKQVQCKIQFYVDAEHFMEKYWKT